MWDVEELIYEVFVARERHVAELRLSAQEALCLEREHGCTCSPQSEPDESGKRWYLVRRD